VRTVEFLLIVPTVDRDVGGGETGDTFCSSSISTFCWLAGGLFNICILAAASAILLAKEFVSR
jgi:hypothetical protein